MAEPFERGKDHCLLPGGQAFKSVPETFLQEVWRAIEHSLSCLCHMQMDLPLVAFAALSHGQSRLFQPINNIGHGCLPEFELACRRTWRQRVMAFDLLQNHELGRGKARRCGKVSPALIGRSQDAPQCSQGLVCDLLVHKLMTSLLRGFRQDGLQCGPDKGKSFHFRSIFPQKMADFCLSLEKLTYFAYILLNIEEIHACPIKITSEDETISTHRQDGSGSENREKIANPNHNKENNIRFRKPTPEDGPQVTALIAACPPLDPNSAYCNLLQCSHFADTCVLAERQGEDGPQLAGWISAYRPPAAPDELFVWQVAVHESARGLSLARRMLEELLARPAFQGVTKLTTTITEANDASWGLFGSFARHQGAGLHKRPHFERDAHFAGAHDTEFLVTIEPLTTAPAQSDPTHADGATTAQMEAV